jgi:hypothetical protein
LVSFTGFGEPEWIRAVDLDAPKALAEWQEEKQRRGNQQPDLRGVPPPPKPAKFRKVKATDPVVVDHIVATRERDNVEQYLCVVDVEGGPADYLWLNAEEIRDLDKVPRTDSEEGQQLVLGAEGSAGEVADPRMIEVEPERIPEVIPSAGGDVVGPREPAVQPQAKRRSPVKSQYGLRRRR